jgi:hypothetical protein
MRIAFIVLLLGATVFVPQSAWAEADTPPLKAPTNPTPASGAPFISFPLQLDWEDIPEAQSYRYELMEYSDWFQKRTQQEKDAWIKEWTDAGIKDWMEDGIENGFLAALSLSNFSDSSILKFLEPWYSVAEYQKKCIENFAIDPNESCTDSQFRTFVKDQQKRSWRVKSCENAEGTKCDPWSEVWDFTYLLGPAVLKTPAANATLSIPITLNWDDIPGANSYDLITLPCPPWGVQDPETDCYSLPISSVELILPSEYQDNECLFTRKSEYVWGVASCLDAQASFCTHPDDISFQYFYTSASAPPLSTPDGPTPLEPFAKEDAPPTNSATPENIPSVSKNTLLRWNGDMCAYFYRVNVFNEAGTRITEDDCLFSGSACTFDPAEPQKIEIGDETLLLEKVKRLWDQPGDLDKTYSWSVTPCWGSMNASFTPTPDCTNTTDSIQWYFHTTGRPPTLTSPENGVSTKVPIVLGWSDEDGASYIYELSSELGIKTGVAIGDTMALVSYESGLIEPSKEYSWKVKTCVDSAEEVEKKTCGEWSNVSTFHTYPLLTPTDPEPTDQTNFSLPGTLKWKPDDGANYYQYQVRYTSLTYGVDEDGNDILEDRPACTDKTMGDTVIPKPGGVSPITSQPSFYLSEYCRGEYEWLVLSCADEDCNVKAAAPATLWKFTAAKQTSEENAGLVPCGKTIDHTNTPFDETEPCELKHAGFLLQNLLDFILWKVSLFVLLILAVITGATSYFSLGGPNALARIKTVFKSFFVGFLMLMFAWMFVNIVLMLFGFQFEFFGTWWELSF